MGAGGVDTESARLLPTPRWVVGTGLDAAALSRNWPSSGLAVGAAASVSFASPAGVTEGGVVGCGFSVGGGVGRASDKAFCRAVLAGSLRSTSKATARQANIPPPQSKRGWCRAKKPGCWCDSMKERAKFFAVSSDASIGRPVVRATSLCSIRRVAGCSSIGAASCSARRRL